MNCSSPGLGKGSKFTVCLPRDSVAEHRIERRRALRIEVHSAQKLKIMVVDKNADCAEMLVAFLHAAGHEVVTDFWGRDAFERSKVVAPDVLIVDLGLADVDVSDLVRKLRTQDETSHAVLIALTDYESSIDPAQTLAAGFDHYLVKPVDLAILCKLLSEVHQAELKAQS